jgi:tetratricopeptide (TPR) repeat protein
LLADPLKAGYHARIGGLQLRLGEPAAAATSWRTALEDYQRSREDAAKTRFKTRSANGGVRTALLNPRTAEEGMARMLEFLGNREEALRWSKEAVRADNDPKNAALRLQLRRVHALAVHLQWLVSGEQGDYRPLLGRAASAQIRAELAYGWADWVSQLTSTLYPMPARIEAARTAVPWAARSTIRGRKPRADGHWRSGAEQNAAVSFPLCRRRREGERLTESARVLTLARGILAELDRSGTLPKPSRDGLIAIGNDLATVNTKLAALLESPIPKSAP